MSDFRTRLLEELDRVPVVDPHAHLRPARPQADNLADIVLYHHVWIELVSAGMPAEAVTRAGLPHEMTDPGLAPLERLRAALPYLPFLRNTTSGTLLRTILQELYGVPGGTLTAANLEEVDAAVSARAADPAWGEQLLAGRCRVARVLTVEHPEQEACCGLIGRGLEGVPTNLVSGKLPPAEMLPAIEERLGRPLRGGSDYAEAMHALGESYSGRDLRFAAVWLIPDLRYRERPASEVDGIMRRARRGQPLDADELGVFSWLGLTSFLEGVRRGRLRTIQFMVGAQVLLPHRSITQWSPELPEALGRLAARFPDLHFNCTAASDLHTQDMAILAKHVPNVSVAGYWWHTLYPRIIRKSLEIRLDAVPANKIVAFFSDAYHAEWCYPKLKMVQGILADILTERVERGWYTPETALSLVRPLFHDNAARIYGVADPGLRTL